MAKTDVMTWDTTANNNTEVNSQSIAENQLPGSLNNAIREAMSQLVRELATQGSDITAASTTAIAATGTSAYVKITGTTTITSFGTPSGKPRRWIQWGAATPVTHNATSMILLGGASRTMAAGDVSLFVHEGSGNWRELARFKGDGSLFSSVATADIANDAVTYAKIQNVSAASRLLGRGSAGGAGDTEEIALGAGLAMSTTTLTQTGVIQTVVASSSSATSNAANIAFDSSIPQNTEGTQLFSQAFTPKSASSTLLIECNIQASNTGTGVDMCIALFVDSTADAIAAAGQGALAGDLNNMRLTYTVASGSTSARTYALRYGASSGTMYINQSSGGVTYGSSRIFSTMTITEIL